LRFVVLAAPRAELKLEIEQVVSKRAGRSLPAAWASNGAVPGHQGELSWRAGFRRPLRACAPRSTENAKLAAVAVSVSFG
jgi:hypothetical protein